MPPADCSSSLQSSSKDTNAIDAEMHLDKAGYAYIPEEGSVLGLLGMHNPNDSIIRYTIAHILREEGDVMGYHYDFGDNWWVDIKVLFRCTFFRNPPLNVYSYSLKRLHLAKPAQAPSPYSMVLVVVLQMASSLTSQLAAPQTFKLPVI